MLRFLKWWLKFLWYVILIWLTLGFIAFLAVLCL